MKRVFHTVEITEKKKQFYKPCSKCGNCTNYIKWIKINNCNSNCYFKQKISQILRHKSALKLVNWTLGAEEEHTIFRLLLKKNLGKKVFTLIHHYAYFHNIWRWYGNLKFENIEIKCAVILSICLRKSLKILEKRVRSRCRRWHRKSSYALETFNGTGKR